MKTKHSKQTTTPSMAESTQPKKAGTPQSGTPQVAVPNGAEHKKQEAAGPATTQPAKTGTKTILPIQSLQSAGKMGGKTYIKVPESGWTDDYYGTICQFDQYPREQAMQDMETKNQVWVVESIDVTITGEQTVRRNRHYTLDLESAIGLAARIDIRPEVAEEVVAIRPAEKEEMQEYFKVLDVQDTMKRPSLTKSVARAIQTSGTSSR